METLPVNVGPTHNENDPPLHPVGENQEVLKKEV